MEDGADADADAMTEPYPGMLKSSGAMPDMAFKSIKECIWCAASMELR